VVWCTTLSARCWGRGAAAREGKRRPWRPESPVVLEGQARVRQQAGQSTMGYLDGTWGSAHSGSPGEVPFSRNPSFRAMVAAPPLGADAAIGCRPLDLAQGVANKSPRRARVAVGTSFVYPFGGAMYTADLASLTIDDGGLGNDATGAHHPDAWLASYPSREAKKLRLGKLQLAWGSGPGCLSHLRQSLCALLSVCLSVSLPPSEPQAGQKKPPPSTNHCH
jgi:hypothetical protein